VDKKPEGSGQRETPTLVVITKQRDVERHRNGCKNGWIWNVGNFGVIGTGLENHSKDCPYALQLMDPHESVTERNRLHDSQITIIDII